MENKKNILIIAIDLAFGGAEKVAAMQANILTELGHNVHIFLQRNAINYTINPSVHVTVSKYCYSNIGYISSIEHRLVANEINCLLSCLESGGKHFVVFLHTFRRFVNYIKHPACYFWVHNTVSDQYKERGFIRAFIRTAKEKSTKKGKQLVCVSQGVRNSCIKVLKLNSYDMSVIYNPFDQNEISALGRASCTTPIKYEYIIHVGRLNLKQKRHDLLLDAYEKSKIRAKLVIVGKGKDRKLIEEMIHRRGLEKQIQLYGYAKNPYPLIKNAKFLILNSDFEGFGNVLVEALMLGTPVISTACPSGPDEILVKEYKKWLCPIRDIEKLAELMRQVDAQPYYIDFSLVDRFQKGVIAQQLLTLC